MAVMTEEKLKQYGYNFPERVNIVLCRDAKGKFSLSFNKYSSKKIKVENIKHSDTGVFFWDGTIGISLGVFDFKTFEEFDEKINDLEVKWIKDKVNEK